MQVFYHNTNAVIHIVLSLRELFFYNDMDFLHWPVAIGKAQTPTPCGRWYVINKKILPQGVYGTRWLGLNNPSYGIHGTNRPDSIGSAVSMGCVRMHNAHIERLFPQVAINTPVVILQHNVYFAKYGDSLFSVAKDFLLPLSYLKKKNPYLNDSILQAGQMVILF